MPDHDSLSDDDLQFDRAVTELPASIALVKVGVTCEACKKSIDTEYYDVNGNVVCDRCRRMIESAAETPTGLMPLVRAGVFGLAAGIAGAAIYFAVIAFAHLEIGIVAILIGYMVGYAIRKGAHGRGGLRFQIMAIALTYLSVAIAYTPLAVRQMTIDANRQASPAASPKAGTDGIRADDGAPRVPRRPTVIGLLTAIALLLAFIVALPVLVVAGSFPSGLISAFIIYIGMRQAWKMTGAPWVQVLGPYRVGSDPATTLA